MPQAVVYIATVAANWAAEAAVAAGLSASASFAVAATAYAVTEAAIYTAVAVGVSMALMPKPPALGSIQSPYKLSMPERQSGFGKTRLSGPYMLYEAAQGGLFLVIALHDGAITAYHRYFLHDDEVEVDGATMGVFCPEEPKKYAYGGPPGNRVFIETRLGANPNTALLLPQALNVAVPGQWTSLHRGDGVACMAVSCKQSKASKQAEDFPNGPPQPSVVASLAPVFDPREGQDQGDPDTYEWSANPVLQLLAYLTNASGGMGFDYTRRILPAIAEWSAAAADCDLPVELLAGGTEPRYAAGGVYKHSTNPSDVIGQILGSFDGWLWQRGDGALSIRPGRYVAPTVTIRDEHVVAYSVQHFTADEESVNELVPSYSDPNSKYNLIDAGAWQDLADIAARGKVRSEPLPLPWVQSPSQARRLAKRRMSRMTAPLRGSITCNLYGFIGRGERYLQLRIRENAALSDIVVEVTRARMDLASLQITFEWVEADPDIDAWNRFTEEQPGVAVPERPTTDELEAPEITAYEAFYEQTSETQSGARLRLTVSAPIVEDVEWKVRWRVDGSDSWIESSNSDVDDGASVVLETGFVTSEAMIEVQVAYVTAGSQSDWSASVFVPVFGVTLEPITDEADVPITDENGFLIYAEPA